MKTAQRLKKPVSIAQLNGWRMHRQYLDRPYSGKSIVDLIKQIGWIYSPGCSTPYLALRARMPSFKTADLNKLVFSDNFQLVQLETLRGCTMLLPREHAGAALRIRNRTFTELAKQARQLMPFGDAELEQLRLAILKSLQAGPKTTDQIRNAVPSALIRDFPLECKRIGLAGSLSLAVNLLKEEGKILKIQTKRRLDSNEYSYALLSDILPEIDLFGLRAEEANRQLAAHYFKVEAPARARDFAWWAGINVTDAMKAAAEVRPTLVSVEVEGSGDEYLISEADLEAFREFERNDTVSVSLIPYRDTFLKGQREIVNRFVRDEHADKPFSRIKGKLVNDPLATVVADGEVIGVWQWNSTKKEIDYILFDSAPSRNLERGIRKRASDMSDFIRASLGEIRLQGLDVGPHQITCIHELKTFWGRGVRVDASAV